MSYPPSAPQPAQPYPYQQPGPNYQQPQWATGAADVPNYRAWSIVSIIFGGVFGIIALIFSFQVDEYLKSR